MRHDDETEHPKICFDRILPLDLKIVAAQHAVEENEYNSPRHIFGDRMMAMGIASYPMKMALLTHKRWTPGRRLRCAFLDGTGTQRDNVVSIAQEWSRYANIQFDFGGSSAAEIRIAFREGDGSWSAVGTDALVTEYFRPNDPTMNFGWLDQNATMAEYRRVVLHEFGHALGAIHEHQNPLGNPLQWNREAVYRRFSGSPNFWSKEEIDHNILQRYSLAQLNASRYDPDSIMLYGFPPELLLDGIGTRSNGELSAMDKQFIGEWYPAAGHRGQPRSVGVGGSEPRPFAPTALHAVRPSPSSRSMALAGESTPASAGVVLPDITVFEHADYGGDSWRTSFAYSYVGDDWNDKISSFIIHAGSFQFFEHRDFGAEHWGPVTLGPGYYRWVGDVGIHNDSISSWHAFYG
ncbi:MAG: beta/gamma crystallin-related protein [Fimbriimonas sp.]